MPKTLGVLRFRGQLRVEGSILPPRRHRSTGDTGRVLHPWPEIYRRCLSNRRLSLPQIVMPSGPDKTSGAPAGAPDVGGALVAAAPEIGAADVSRATIAASYSDRTTGIICTGHGPPVLGL